MITGLFRLAQTGTAATRGRGGGWEGAVEAGLSQRVSSQPTLNPNCPSGDLQELASPHMLNTLAPRIPGAKGLSGHISSNSRTVTIRHISPAQEEAPAFIPCIVSHVLVNICNLPGAADRASPCSACPPQGPHCPTVWGAQDSGSSPQSSWGGHVTASSTHLLGQKESSVAGEEAWTRELMLLQLLLTRPLLGADRVLEDLGHLV